MASGRWSDPFDEDRKASMQAISEWLQEEPKVKACRSELVYPPIHDGDL